MRAMLNHTIAKLCYPRHLGTQIYLLENERKKKHFVPLCSFVLEGVEHW